MTEELVGVRRESNHVAPDRFSERVDIETGGCAGDPVSMEKNKDPVAQTSDGVKDHGRVKNFRAGEASSTTCAIILGPRPGELGVFQGSKSLIRIWDMGDSSSSHKHTVSRDIKLKAQWDYEDR